MSATWWNKSILIVRYSQIPLPMRFCIFTILRQNVDKYQLSEIRFFPQQRRVMNNSVEIFCPLHSYTFNTKEEDLGMKHESRFFKWEVAILIRTQMGQLNCWQIPIFRNSTFAHRTEIVNALAFLFTGDYFYGT